MRNLHANRLEMRWTRTAGWNGGDINIASAGVEKINVNIFSDTYKAMNNFRIGTNEMKVIDYENSVRWNNAARPIAAISYCDHLVCRLIYPFGFTDYLLFDKMWVTTWADVLNWSKIVFSVVRLFWLKRKFAKFVYSQVCKCYTLSASAASRFGSAIK